MPALLMPEVGGQGGRAGQTGGVADHQEVQGLVLEVLEPDCADRG